MQCGLVNRGFNGERLKEEPQMSGQFPLEVMFPKLMAWKFTPNVGVTRQSWHVLSRSEHRVCVRGFPVIFMNTAAVTVAV